MVLADLCERARLRGRPREVLELLGTGLEPEEVAERLGIAVATVYVHSRTARAKLRQAALRHEEFEFHRFILHEAIGGPAVSNPKEGLYRVTGPGMGERVRVNAGPLVTVADLQGGRREGPAA